MTYRVRTFEKNKQTKTNKNLHKLQLTQTGCYAIVHLL